jgi:hypothetical protein
MGAWEGQFILPFSLSSREIHSIFTPYLLTYVSAVGMLYLAGSILGAKPFRWPLDDLLQRESEFAKWQRKRSIKPSFEVVADWYNNPISV